MDNHRGSFDLRNEVEILAPGDPAQASKQPELQQSELEYLIERQTAYGISNFF